AGGREAGITRHASLRSSTVRHERRGDREVSVDSVHELRLIPILEAKRVAHGHSCLGAVADESQPKAEVVAIRDAGFAHNAPKSLRHLDLVRQTLAAGHA